MYSLSLQSSSSIALHCLNPWSFTLREEHRQREFQSRMLRKMFGLKREDGVTGDRRKSQSEELHDMY
jgi:hypothetical protein